MTNLIWQLFRFGMVGFTAALVHFFLVVFIVQMGSVEPLIANVFAFALSFQVSYWGHRWWTFSSSMVQHRDAFPRLLLIQTAGFAANESLFYIFLQLHLPYPIALIIVLTIIPIFTFVSSKLWVYR